MENTKLIDLIVKEKEHLSLTMQDARDILKALEGSLDFYDNEELMILFIEDDLMVFKEKQGVFDWFYDSDGNGSINQDVIDFDIKSDMLGKNVKDILLECNHNYVKVNDDLYVSWGNSWDY